MFIIILRTSPKLFPPKNIVQLQPSLKDGILMTSNRLSELVYLKYYKNVKLPIISHEDKELTRLILSNSHTFRVGLGINPIHLTKKLTNINTKKQQYGVFITRLSTTVRNYVDNCVPCKKAKCETLTTKEGNIYPLEHYQANMGLFGVIQIDIIGPYHVSFTGKETRGNRPLKIWVLVVLDLLTSGVNMIMMKDYSTKGLITALSFHSL